MEATENITDGIVLIDQMWNGNPYFSSTYIISGSTIALFDAGPTTVTDRVLDAAHKIGFRPEEISYLIYSHIHVDHAGGAGMLVKRYPHMKVLVHEQGAPHMINPEKLVQSMKRVFGDNAEKWYGEVIPVPERNLHPLKDGEEIDLGNGKILEIRHTPGHATHHLSVFDRSGGSLLAGEALGVYLPEVNVFFPSTPPPEFDLEQAVDSIAKLEGLPIERVLFSHFGSVAQSQQAVKTAKEMLIRWGRVIHHAMTETSQPDEILGKLSEEALHAIEHIRDNNALYEKYKALVEFRSRFTCGPGYIRYFNKGGAVL